MRSEICCRFGISPFDHCWFLGTKIYIFVLLRFNNKSVIEIFIHTYSALEEHYNYMNYVDNDYQTALSDMRNKKTSFTTSNFWTDFNSEWLSKVE